MLALIPTKTTRVLTYADLASAETILGRVSFRGLRLDTDTLSVLSGASRTIGSSDILARSGTAKIVGL